MVKSLVIVESPAKAKTINKYLGAQYIVKSSIGHIRDLPVSGSTTKSTPKSGKRTIFDRMGIYPDQGWSANYQILPGKEKVVQELRQYAKTSDKVYLATDLDREGEAIAWHLKEVIGKGKEFRRVTFNEITKSAIQKAFEQSGEIDIQRVNAQQARRFLDRIVGFLISPLLWEKVARGLSAGRVQSVATKLIIEREREIQKFIPKEYWRIFAQLIGKQGTVNFEVTKYNNAKLDTSSKQQTQSLEHELSQLDFSITERKVKPASTRPSPPLITSTMQQMASTRLGFSVKRTMIAAQKLYEAGFITYMRTDSTNISADAINALRDFIGENFATPYLPDKPRYYTSKSAAQEAHEAIRPTDVTLEKCAIRHKDGERLYQIIRDRFIACQMTDARYENTTLLVRTGKFTLEAKGRVKLFDGFTKVIDNSNSADLIELPAMEQNESLDLSKISSSQHFTKPPPRYSEATLVRELEKRSIGRPSTYAPTISTIQERGYVSLRNKKFHAEKIGAIVTERLDASFTELMSYNFTAAMEKNLDAIASGNSDWKELLDNFYRDLEINISKAKDSEDGMKANDPIITDLECSNCQRKMVVRYGSSGEFLGCSGYGLPKKERCTNTVNLIAYDQLPDLNEEEDEALEIRMLQEHRRCSLCNASMDPYLVDNNHKLHICSNSPECHGIEIEEGEFLVREENRSKFTCDTCNQGEFILKSGRFGKYFDCSNPDCNEKRKMLTNGNPSEAKMKPVDMPEIACRKVDDHYVLRDGSNGLFLAASKFPKNRETRPVQVREMAPHRNEIDDKYHYLVDGPQQDPEGNPTIVRYSRKNKEIYIGSEKDSKATRWGVYYREGLWKNIS